MNNIKGLSEKKRGEVLSMESLHAVAGLIQQMDSHRDDSGGEMMGASVSCNGANVHIGKDTFLSAFNQFEIEVNEESKYPYRLTESIGGVEFVAIFKASDIVNLKEIIPEQWEYIQKKLQGEAS